MESFLHLINEMSPYLLLGFFLAGLMHAFIPGTYYSRYLSQPSFKSVVNATIFGIPLPLCSCGVIPTAMSLRKEGASNGAVTSFLIATPQTGVDSIIATYSLMGWPFAVIRPLAALVTAVFGGTMVNLTGSNEGTAAEHNCQDDCCHSKKSVSFAEKVQDALHYAFVDMMADIGKWLVVGLVVAGLITVFVPKDFFAYFEGNTFASMLLVLCIAVPMYLCATGSIPIAVALMLKGLTPGAGLVLLMAGPACNVASMLVVRKVLGTRTLITYIGSIVLGAIAFGCLIDYLQFGGMVDFLGNLVYKEACCMEPRNEWFSWICTGVLLLLLVNALFLPKLGVALWENKQVEQTETADEEEDNVVVYRVEGMNCNHCRAAAENALRAVPGVVSASVDLPSKEARVSGTASEEALRNALEAIGFELYKD